MTAPDDPATATLAAIRERAMGVSVEDVDRAVPAVREALATLDHSASEFAAKIAYDVLMSAHPDYRSAIARLLKAVEAALKPHQPGRVVIFGTLCKRHEAHRHFSIDAREAADVRACPDCSATVYASCTGCGPGVNTDACPVREAITRELSGKGSTDEQR